MPYIDVPTLPDASKIFNKEMEGVLKDSGDTSLIKIEERQVMIDDAYFEPIKGVIFKAITETV